MTPAVERVIVRVMASEGGIADVGDGKGVTRFGQTERWLKDHGLPIPTTPNDAMDNYETWLTQTRLDEICDRDETLGHAVVDFAVHSGDEQAIKGLQRALRVHDDGVIGPQTRAALAAADLRTLVHRVAGERIRFIGLLLGSRKVDRRQWAAGWCNRLADMVEAL